MSINSNDISDEDKVNFLHQLENLIMLNFGIEVWVSDERIMLTQHFNGKNNQKCVVDYMIIQFIGDMIDVSCTPKCYLCKPDVNEVIMCLIYNYKIPLLIHKLN